MTRLNIAAAALLALAVGAHRASAQLGCEGILRHGIHDEESLRFRQGSYISFSRWMLQQQQSSRSVQGQTNASASWNPYTALFSSQDAETREVLSRLETGEMLTKQDSVVLDRYTKTVSPIVVSAWRSCMEATGLQASYTPSGDSAFVVSFRYTPPAGDPRASQFATVMQFAPGDGVTCTEDLQGERIYASGVFTTCTAPRRGSTITIATRPGTVRSVEFPPRPEREMCYEQTVDVPAWPGAGERRSCGLRIGARDIGWPYVGTGPEVTMAATIRINGEEFRWQSRYLPSCSYVSASNRHYEITFLGGHPPRNEQTTPNTVILRVLEVKPNAEAASAPCSGLPRV